MSVLAERLRREVDAVAPVTLAEVRAVVPQRRVRRRAGLRVAIGVALLPAALVAVILLATHLDRSRPVAVQTRPTGAPVTVWITVRSSTVPPGEPVQATVHVRNDTGAAVGLGDTCPGGWPPIELVGPAGTFQASSTSVRCSPHMAVPRGESRYDVTVSTWAICNVGYPGIDTMPPCGRQPTSIPVGRYQVQISDARLPAGTHLATSPTITVLPQTLDQFRDFGAIPPGYGALFGSLGPGIPGHSGPPDLTLVFTQGARRVETQAIGGRYEVFLPAGTWDARSTDGTVCARGLTVGAGGGQSDDLVWPIAGCQDLSGPPPPSANQA